MNNHSKFCSFVFFVLALCGGLPAARAQKADTSDKMIIHILNNKLLTFTKTDSGDFFRFVGDVIMQQGTDTLYCDSLYQNKTTNILEAFSNVRIAQLGGTQGLCDYLKYTSAVKLAYMKGHVSLTDGKNKLWCEELTYDLGTKTGVYNNHGTLNADSTIVTSEKGIYNVNSKEARFTGHVIVADPNYYTTSEDLGYNTESKLTRFFAPSVVTGDSGRTILQTSSGTYDSHKGMADFDTHSSVWYDGYYIEGDTLHYNKITGYGYAYGNVVGIDTAHHSTLYCGRATYNKRKRILWAVDKPVLVQVNNRDTLYMRADTFYSAPIVKTALLNGLSGNDTLLARRFTDNHSNKDSVKQMASPVRERKGRKKEKELTPPTFSVADTTDADTSLPLYFTGYHHVRIFSDSMQGLCDSIVYTQNDSTIRMIYNPILWSRNSQVTGDTILMKMDSGKINNVYVPNNAFVVSLAASQKAEIYDQVQGKTLRAYFKDNAINMLNVFPNAEAIYYPKDDSGFFIGVSQATSTRMRVFFNDQKIDKIKFEQDVHQTLTPLEKADLPSTRLSRFKWLIKLRPKNKEELFND